jgi:hypothetical protein
VGHDQLPHFTLYLRCPSQEIRRKIKGVRSKNRPFDRTVHKIRSSAKSNPESSSISSNSWFPTIRLKVNMKNSARRSVRLLVDATRSGVLPRRHAARTFVSTSSASRQEQSTRRTSGANTVTATDKLKRAPIAWFTATTSYSEEAKAFVSGPDNEHIDSFEVIPDEKEEPTTSIIARSKVRRGIIVECRR